MARRANASRKSYFPTERRAFADQFFRPHETTYLSFLECRSTLVEPITLPKYRVADTGATYRIIQTWREAGLLCSPPTPKAKRFEWQRFSIADVLLIHLYGRFRRIGVPLSTLTIAGARLREGDVLDRDPRKTDPKLRGVYLAFAVTRVQMGQDLVAVICPDGRAGIGSRLEYVSALDEGLLKEHATVDVNETLYKIVPAMRRRHDAYVQEFSGPIWVNEAEWLLLQHVRGGLSDKVTATVKRGRVLRITTEGDVGLDPKDQKTFARSLASYIKDDVPFGGLNIVTKNGKPVTLRGRRVIHTADP